MSNRTPSSPCQLPPKSSKCRSRSQLQQGVSSTSGNANTRRASSNSAEAASPSSSTIISIASITSSKKSTHSSKFNNSKRAAAPQCQPETPAKTKTTKSSDEFVPEKVQIRPGASRRRVRRPGRQESNAASTNSSKSGNSNLSETSDGNAGSNLVNSRNSQGNQSQQHQKQRKNHSLESSQYSQASEIASSVIFYEDGALFDEIDELYPHEHEGGNIVTDPNDNTQTNANMSSITGTHSSHNQSHHSSAYTGSTFTHYTHSTLNNSYANSYFHSLQGHHNMQHHHHHVPTDYDTLMASTVDGNLAADIILEIEDRKASLSRVNQDLDQQQQHYHNLNEHLDDRSQNLNQHQSQHKPEHHVQYSNGYNENYTEETVGLRPVTSSTSMGHLSLHSYHAPSTPQLQKRESVVGGKHISEMTFQEQRQILAPERSESSLVIEAEDNFGHFEEDSNGDDGGLTLEKLEQQGHQLQNNSKLREQFGSMALGESGSHHVTLCTYSPILPINNINNNNSGNSKKEGSGQLLMVSSVDWSSLTRSCKRAKNAFRDAESGQIVVKNMFMTHLSALTTVLTLHAKKYGKDALLLSGGGGGSNGGSGGGSSRSSSSSISKSLDEIKSRTTETKRALRFGMSCLAPSRGQEGAEEHSSISAAMVSDRRESGTTVGGSGYATTGRTSIPVVGSDFREDVEKYRGGRHVRQELQEAGVEFFTNSHPHSPSSQFQQHQSPSASPRESTIAENEHSRYGLQIPLAEIILGVRPWKVSKEEKQQLNAPKPDKKRSYVENSFHSASSDGSGSNANGGSVSKIIATIEKDQLTVRMLAARMMCNLVTDNPVSAEVVLMDVPFGPAPEELERRLAASALGGSGRGGDSRKGVHSSSIRSTGSANSSHSTYCISKDDGGMVCWSDLVQATAKIESGLNGSSNVGNDHYYGREALAAVAASLHNLLASLETRDSLLELEHEIKRREKLKELRMRRRRSSAFGGNEIEVEGDDSEPIDAGFEAATNQPLINALLRNMLPANAVITEARRVSSFSDNSSRPNFRSASAVSAESSFQDMSDSATEWISLVLERLASRGLLPQMFQSAGSGYDWEDGGKEDRGHSSSPSIAVTPEQVVLISCVRQAVDDYHSARTASGESGEFGRRRLSIAAKSAGMTVMTRPHPLWGRVEEDFARGGIPSGGFGTARGKQRQGARNSRVVPVLTFIANEVERIRRRVKTLQARHSKSDHDKTNKINEMYEGEVNCAIRVIDDMRDMLAQCLSKNVSSFHSMTLAQKHKLCSLSEARLVVGRDTSLIVNCCEDLAKIIDKALGSNSGGKARELKLTPEEQHSAVIMVRLIANIAYQCRTSQDALRTSHIPGTTMSTTVQRSGLHVLLSATSLAPACFTLREWCIVAIRNAVEDNEANADAVRNLEANRALGDTPELRKLGVKLDLDAKGKVQVSRRDSL